MLVSYHPSLGILLLAMLVALPAAAELRLPVRHRGRQFRPGVPGATVTLTNERTADVRTQTSGGRGDFMFQAVPPGSYTVKMSSRASAV